MSHVDESDPRVRAIVARPYLTLVEPGPEGYFTASILEFPGCVTSGESAEAAVRELDELFPAFVATRIEHNQSIPEPVELGSHSGRITVRIPPSLHAAAARRAAVEGISLNRLLSEAVARYVGLA